MAVVRTGNGPAHARDIGPAAAAVDGMAAMGRLSALRVDRGALVADTASAAGAGPIERRTETPIERAARLARDTVPPRPKSTPRPVAAPSRAKEDPVTVSPTPPAAAPCGTCLHAPVCRLRAALEELGPLAPVQVIESGLRAVATAWVLECDHHLAAPAGSRPIVRTAARDAESRRRGGQATKAATQRIKAERAAAVMAALERHGGDRTAAARELGMKLNALTMVAKYAEGRLGAGAGS